MPSRRRWIGLVLSAAALLACGRESTRGAPVGESATPTQKRQAERSPDEPTAAIEGDSGAGGSAASGDDGEATGSATKDAGARGGSGGASGKAANGHGDAGGRAEGGNGGEGGSYDGTIECDETPVPVPAQAPHRLVSGFAITLLHRPDGTIVRWGDPFTEESRVLSGSADPSTLHPLDGEFTAITAGYQAACGVRSNGDPLCTSFTCVNVGVEVTPPGPFTELAVNGNDFACGLRPDGTAVCWGYIEAPPPGPFVRLVASDDHVCGIRTDSTVACWRGLTYPVRAGQTCGTFRELAAGFRFTCGIRPDRTLYCWGGDYFHSGILQPPEGTFARVAALVGHACAIRTDGTLACWGTNYYGESKPPSGEFVDVTVGYDHSCALRANGTVACWGQNARGQASPPPELL